MSEFEWSDGGQPTDTGVLWRGVERGRLVPLLERCEAMLTETEGADLGRCPECNGGPGAHAEGCSLAALLSDLRKELGK